MKYQRQQIEMAMAKLGHKYFTNGEYNVNIIGIRNSSTGDKVTNAFDDLLTLSFKVNGEWVFYQWDATTEPGKKGMLEGKAAGGVSFVVPGQYPGSHAIGLHQGKYEALKQCGNIKVYRDGDRDLVFDKDKISEGVFGINIHKAGVDSTFVENWSEGCQVFKREAEFNVFMSFIKKAATIHGNRFTYTLIESKHIPTALG
jgi:hypothetical protein